MIKQNKHIIVFAPHPDDETLACGGMLAIKTASGCRTSIVVMTDGSQSHSAVLGMKVNPTPHELVPIRQAEVRNAASILGVALADITFLPFQDRDLINQLEPAVQAIRRVLLSVSTPQLELYFPHQVDSHRDHKATFHAVTQALSGFKFSCKLELSLFCYVVWESGEPPRLPNLKFDIRDVLPLKIQAINAYTSQIGLLTSSQESPILSKEFVQHFCQKPVEDFWQYPLEAL